MNTYANSTPENRNQSLASAISQKETVREGIFQIADHRPVVAAQRKLQELADNSQRVGQLRAYQEMADKSLQRFRKGFAV